MIVATGSEVSVALEARQLLAGDGIDAAVVSMPSWELFEAQPQSYRDEVLPDGLPIVSVEAGVPQGWERYAGGSVALRRFGASAPAAEVFERLGITAGGSRGGGGLGNRARVGAARPRTREPPLWAGALRRRASGTQPADTGGLGTQPVVTVAVT